MTADPPRNLPDDVPDDVFVDRSDSPGPHLARTSHQHISLPLVDLHELNRQSVESNRALYSTGASSPATRGDDIVIKSSPAHGQIHFEAHTTSPSPPISVNTSGETSDPANKYSPLPSGHKTSSLLVSTNMPPASPRRSDSLKERNSRLSSAQQNPALQRKTSNSNLQPVSRTPSWKQHFSKGISSTTSSACPSPVISALGDVTPLPSPLLSSDSPGPWRRLVSPIPSRELTVPTIMPDSVFVTKSGESVATALENQNKRKVYAGLQVGHAAEHSSGKHEHTRNRSISEYIPDPKGIPKRQNTVSTGKVDERIREDPAGLRREPRLSEARGLALPATPPTPPPSESSLSNDTSGSKRPAYEYFEARGRKDQKLRRWRGIEDLGEGTFSRVVLATNKLEKDINRENRAPITVSQLDRKKLVAIKICEHGPKGGASEDRIEMSLKRELDIMRSIDHPSLVHLKAWSIEPTRALLVLNYSPGGDLFDVASNYRDSLKAPILRRIFSEVVGAVGYLHERRIVHRDIKLENVLVNITPAELISPTQDWTTYPYPVITLTDLGLSRRVADDEKLETRCGSDDYAAPEVILGQPYDGRATDAWSLGVLLYALIESRLPFDPPPGANDYQRMRSRTSHRIARVEWSWVKYVGEDGDHDANIALFEKDGLKGAMEITEGLLRRARSRWPMAQVIEHDWVREAIKVDGGLRFPEEEEGQEVL
ncbi:kinase-like protein [Xylaria bambusicola]|uniref:kinase-like protein n=1 Tax=Xylaria bambusicola TaxID=326684 RepID=UPI002008E5CA|nr:kinase-like protein [Xylaria bambusicola]KAI0525604.1 kinase-like protein [Xylaria bambusicola]